MTDSFGRIFKDKRKVLVVMAHPDDTELYAGGTVARLIASGRTVGVVKVTSGDRGSRQEKISQQELRALREQEDMVAMKVFGIKDEDDVYLRFEDGEVTNDIKIIERLAFQIRQFKPEIIITHNPEDVIIRFDENNHWVNHRDHRNTGLCTIDAAYPYSRDRLFFPEHFKNKEIVSHVTTEFLLVDYYGHPETVGIDVTDYIETRIKAHASHASQYSVDYAQSSADFFTKLPGTDRRFERFRHVVAD